MITTLLATTHKAVRAAYVPASKLPRHLKDLPVLHTLRLGVSDGRMTITCPFVNEKGELDANTETVPARIEQEFSTCVPARAFKDWLAASQLTKEEKAKGHNEQVNFMYDPALLLLTVQQGNSRADFLCIDSQDFPFLL